MSRSPFRTSIYTRRRDDAPFVDMPQAISNYSGPDETPDPVCMPGADEVPAAACPACGLGLRGVARYEYDANDCPVEYIYCTRCKREVEADYV